MDRTQHIISNHMIHIDGNYLICKKCRVIPLKIIVKSFMTGSHSKSLWYNYKKGVRNYCGIQFPDGLEKNKPLPELVITPTTKIYKENQLISKDDILYRKIVTEKELFYIYTKALELFKYGQDMAEAKGLILIDTKYEFGYDYEDNIILIGKIHTGDSSGYWKKETYFDRLKNGLEPEKLDMDLCIDYIKPNSNSISEEDKDNIYKCFLNLYERLLSERYLGIRKDCGKHSINDNELSNYFKNIHKELVIILSSSINEDEHIVKIKTQLDNQKIYYNSFVCSPHKNTKKLLELIEKNESSNRRIIYITVESNSNALSSIVAYNTKYIVIACPPSNDLSLNTNLLHIPIKVPVMTILEPENVAISINRIFRI